MADVHRATDEALQREVAVKMLRPIAGGSKGRDRFIAEAQMLAGLSHTGLVTVLDAGFDAERPFLVMELVEGPTLAEVCASPCEPERVESVGAQVGETLAFVHSRGIVHRDVKPGNVLLGPGGQVKLADFGIARLVDQDSGFTRTGFAMGTVAYVSPEQVRGETVTGASDTYSLGLVLLEALTGKREFGGNDLDAAQARLLREPRISDDLPHNWPLLLREMTALDPADRPPPAQVADPRRHAEHLMLLLRHANLCDKPCGLQDEDEHYYDGDHEGENGDRACVHGDVSFIRGATHSGGRRVQRPVPIHALNIGADVDSVRG